MIVITVGFNMSDHILLARVHIGCPAKRAVKGYVMVVAVVAVYRCVQINVRSNANCVPVFTLLRLTPSCCLTADLNF